MRSASTPKPCMLGYQSPMRLGILASRHGSTLRAILDACSSGERSTDDVDALADRVRARERRFLVETLQALTAGRIHLAVANERREQ